MKKPEQAIGTMGEIEAIALAGLQPSPFNPRMICDRDSETIALADNIRHVGLLQPIEARLVDGHHEIVFGHRRVAAARLVGLQTIPAIVRDLTDGQVVERIATENLQRVDLTPVQEGRVIQSLLDKWGNLKLVAAHLGRSMNYVIKRARLSTLSENVQKALAASEQPGIRSLTVSHLEILARLTPASQDELLEELARDGWPVTVADVEQQAADYTHQLSSVTWDLQDADLVPAAGACMLCPKRSLANPGLFDELDSRGRLKRGSVDICLDAACFQGKQRANLQRLVATAKGQHPDLVSACRVRMV